MVHVPAALALGPPRERSSPEQSGPTGRGLCGRCRRRSPPSQRGGSMPGGLPAGEAPRGRLWAPLWLCVRARRMVLQPGLRGRRERVQKLWAARLVVGVDPGHLCLQVSGGSLVGAGGALWPSAPWVRPYLPQEGHHRWGWSVLAWRFGPDPQSCPHVLAGSHVLHLPVAHDLSRAGHAGRGHGGALPPSAVGAALTPGHRGCR